MGVNQLAIEQIKRFVKPMANLFKHRINSTHLIYSCLNVSIMFSWAFNYADYLHMFIYLSYFALF